MKNTYMNTLQELNELKTGNLILRNANDPVMMDKNIEQIKKERRLQKELDTHPINKFIENGIIQEMVEDVDTSTDHLLDALSEINKKWVNKFKDNKNLMNIYGLLQLSPLHQAGQDAIEITAMSDFVYRYVMYNHLIANGTSQDKAMQEIRDIFVDYNQAEPPLLKWLDDNAIGMFFRFGLRSIRVGLSLIQKSPGRTGLVQMGENIIGDVPDIPGEVVTNPPGYWMYADYQKMLSRSLDSPLMELF